MNNKIFLLFLIIGTSVFGSSIADKTPQQKDKNKEKQEKIKETKEQERIVASTKVDTSKLKLKNVLSELDSLDLSTAKLKTLKKGAHASYYHNKFNGRRTASGKRFDNNSYTAAHKKLAFGTKVKVTNEANGKWVIVEITDRGPFSKAREIDLSRRAFMDIVGNKKSGTAIVTIEVIELPK
jgi:rare lipoprotein A